MERRQAADAPRSVSGPPGAEVGGGDAAGPPLCSIVIPTYNGRDLLDRCLASVQRHRPDGAHGSIEVVVVDNGSSDGTSEWLERAYPAVRVVRLEPNRDFCGAANAGLAAARARSSSCSTTIPR